MKHLYKITLIIAAIFIAKTAFPYDRIGHRIVAQIAEDNLTAAAKKQLETIIGKNGLTAGANWADDIKSDHAYDHASKWHYYNIEGNYSPAKLDSIFVAGTKTRNNVLFAIDSLITVLKKNKNDVVALKFLIHFIGDMHQPLHLGQAKDLGGNLIKVKWFKDSVNIHSVWDSQLINMEQLSFTEYAQYLEDASQYSQMKLKSKDLLFSFKQSYAICRKIYNYNYSSLNPYSYKYNFSNDLNGMLVLGGYQLSAILNEIYS
ncbi:MAG: S1/P1 nuclease [Bacteroidota bacterium]